MSKIPLARAGSTPIPLSRTVTTHSARSVEVTQARLSSRAAAAKTIQAFRGAATRKAHRIAPAELGGDPAVPPADAGGSGGGPKRRRAPRRPDRS
jgi:hypothetical protein